VRMAEGEGPPSNILQRHHSNRAQGGSVKGRLDRGLRGVRAGGERDGFDCAWVGHSSPEPRCRHTDPGPHSALCRGISRADTPSKILTGPLAKPLATLHVPSKWMVHGW
jgi:hypothetical protein